MKDLAVFLVPLSHSHRSRRHRFIGKSIFSAHLPCLGRSEPCIAPFAPPQQLAVLRALLRAVPWPLNRRQVHLSTRPILVVVPPCSARRHLCVCQRAPTVPPQRFRSPLRVHLPFPLSLLLLLLRWTGDLLTPPPIHRPCTVRRRLSPM